MYCFRNQIGQITFLRRVKIMLIFEKEELVSEGLISSYLQDLMQRWFLLPGSPSPLCGPC